MKRPSGTTLVTAVLGAFVIFGIVSSYLAKRADAIRHISLHSSANAGLGYLLNGGAWKAGFAVEAGGSAPEPAQASVPVVAPPVAASEASMPTARRVGATPIVANPLTEEVTEIAPTEPEETPRAEEEPKKESARPPPQGRMGLAGPAEQHKPAAVPAAAPRALPHDQAHSPAPSVSQTPPPPPQESGPSIFKSIDRNGLN